MKKLERIEIMDVGDYGKVYMIPVEGKIGPVPKFYMQRTDCYAATDTPLAEIEEVLIHLCKQINDHVFIDSANWESQRLKAYQNNWWVDLVYKNNENDLERVCLEIIADDTGHTDKLTQRLAKEILTLLKS